MTISLVTPAAVCTFWALLDKRVLAHTKLTQGCIALLLCSLAHLSFAVYIQQRLVGHLRQSNHMQDYFGGNESSYNQENIMAEMWRFLIKDTGFRVYVVIHVCAFVNVFWFAGHGAEDYAEIEPLTTAAFLLIFHGVLSYSLACCWYAAFSWAVFCESFGSLLLPQRRHRPVQLESPIEVNELKAEEKNLARPTEVAAAGSPLASAQVDQGPAVASSGGLGGVNF